MHAAGNSSGRLCAQPAFHTQRYLGVLVDARLVADVLGAVGIPQGAQRLLGIARCTNGSMGAGRCAIAW